MSEERSAWYRELNAYHWFVFVIASAAWFFDCLDQRLFSLARIPALKALTPTGDVQALGKDVTALFLIGWGVGGHRVWPARRSIRASQDAHRHGADLFALHGLTFFSHHVLGLRAVSFLDRRRRGRRVRLGGRADCRDGAGQCPGRCAGEAADSLDDRQYLGRRREESHRLPGVGQDFEPARGGGGCFWSVRCRRCWSCSR